MDGEKSVQNNWAKKVSPRKVVLSFIERVRNDDSIRLGNMYDPTRPNTPPL